MFPASFVGGMIDSIPPGYTAGTIVRDAAPLGQPTPPPYGTFNTGFTPWLDKVQRLRQLNHQLILNSCIEAY